MITRRALLLGTAATLACRRNLTAAPASKHTRALWAAIRSAGGLPAVSKGDTVVLKVNTNSGDPFPYSTSPVTVRAIASALVAKGARVIVGDRSFWGDGDTAGNLARNGIADAATDAGAEVVVFDDAIDWVEVDPKLVPHWKPPVRIPKVAVEAAHVINLACAKTHFISGVTLGLKNWLGIVHAEDRKRPGNLRTHDADLIHHQIVDVQRALAPSLTVIDGYRALVAGGPTPRNGTVSLADPKVVLAGVDRVAVDIAGITLLQKYAPASEAVHATKPDRHPTILAARAGGL